MPPDYTLLQAPEQQLLWGAFTILQRATRPASPGTSSCPPSPPGEDSQAYVACLFGIAVPERSQEQGCHVESPLVGQVQVAVVPHDREQEIPATTAVCGSEEGAGAPQLASLSRPGFCQESLDQMILEVPPTWPSVIL